MSMSNKLYKAFRLTRLWEVVASRDGRKIARYIRNRAFYRMLYQLLRKAGW